MCMMSQFSAMALCPKSPIPYTRSHRAFGQEGLDANITYDVQELDII